MGLLPATLIGASASSSAATRETVMSEVRKNQPEQPSDGLIDVSGQSSVEQTNSQVLDFLESETANHLITAGGGVVAVVHGGGGVAAIAGGTFSAAGAATAGSYFAVGLAFGMAGGALGSFIGDAAGHGVAQLLGMNKVATSGENIARKGDDIAHQEKDRGLWGAIGGIILGAAAAIAVGAFVILTGGTGLALVAVAAGAFAGGLVGGTVAAVGNALGQYGEVKGKIAEGSANVIANNNPVARAGDKIECDDHPGSGYCGRGQNGICQ